MSSFAEIVEALAVTLEQTLEAAGDDALSAQVYPYRLLQPSPPCLDIFPGDPFANTNSAGFGLDYDAIFTVRARIGTADSDAGQQFLLRLMDAEDDMSVAASLLADQTLGGVIASMNVEGPSGHTIYEDTAHTAAYLGVEWRVVILR